MQNMDEHDLHDELVERQSSITFRSGLSDEVLQRSAECMCAIFALERGARCGCACAGESLRKSCS